MIKNMFRTCSNPVVFEHHEKDVYKTWDICTEYRQIVEHENSKI